jgi:Tol biopolymer transport system component
MDLLGQLWSLRVTGGRATPLTDSARAYSDDSDPSFSPKGDFAVFVSDRPRGRGLWILSMISGSVEQITDGPDCHPSWSPTGRQISFDRAKVLFVYDLKEGTTHKVEIPNLPVSGIRDSSWTPDGKRIVFINESRYAAGGGNVWSVDAHGGDQMLVSSPKLRGLAPAVSPDGMSLALFSMDTSGRMQLHVLDLLDGKLSQLTNRPDVVPSRVRWHPSSSDLYYSADGSLWKLDMLHRVHRPIPFLAKVKIARRPQPPFAKPLRDQRTIMPARGFDGLAISPTGDRLAIIALGKLWLIVPNAPPESISSAGRNAAGLTWSSDGQEIAWSATCEDDEEIFVTNVASRHTYPLTRLRGQTAKPQFSPSGDFIAFIHGKSPGLGPYSLCIADNTSRPVEDKASIREIQRVDLELMFRYSELSEESHHWSKDSKALLVPGKSGARLISLDGDSKPLTDFPRKPMSFLQWDGWRRVAWVYDNRVWTSTFHPSTGGFHDAHPVTREAALYLSMGCDGSLAYVSRDGLRLQSPRGSVLRLGWPIFFEKRSPPQSMRIRNVRIFNGGMISPSEPCDIEIRNGKFAEISSGSGGGTDNEEILIDGLGMVAIPGLIDTHVHLWDEETLEGMLAFGITSVRDVGSPIARSAALRDMVEASAILGPRVFLAGFQFCWDGNYADGLTGGLVQSPETRGGLERALDIGTALGATFVKLRQFGRWDRAVETVRSAHRRGLMVSGHSILPLCLIEAGIDGKEHMGPSDGRMNGILYEDVTRIVKGCGLWVVPTISAFSGLVRIMNDPGLLESPDVAMYVTRFGRFWATRRSERERSNLERAAELAREGTRTLCQAGAKIAAGTDLSIIPHSLHWELEELVRAGATPGEALSCATRNAAEFLGVESDLGSIEVGKIADLLVVDGDPSTDIRDTLKVRYVVKNGLIVEAKRRGHTAKADASASDPGGPTMRPGVTSIHKLEGMSPAFTLGGSG